MRSVEEAMELTDPQEIASEIQVRRKLRYEMVGSLYPNILVDEVGRLVSRYDEMGGKNLLEDMASSERAK